MSMVRAEISISLDGYGAGPNQSPDNPLGEGGERLHDWVDRHRELAPPARPGGRHDRPRQRHGRAHA